MKLEITDKEEIKRAIKADDMCSFIWNFREYIFNELQEDNENPLLIKLNEEFNELLIEKGINIDELWQ